MTSGIGIDLVRLDDVNTTLSRFGDRYRRRTFAACELERADRFRDPVPFLAGRFAAKEAVFKSLGLCADTAFAWRDIVITHRPGLGPGVRFEGSLHGIDRTVSVSISHEGGYAVACALAAPSASPARPRPVPLKLKEVVMHESTIVTVLDAHAKLPMPAGELAADADLYEAGMTSHASVAVMLGLEDALDVEFPDELLTRETFASIQAIDAALAKLTE